MAPRYEKVQAARFTAEVIGGVQRFRIAPRRPIFAIGFLVVWIVGWTTAGGFINGPRLHAGFEPFQIFPVVIWLLGTVTAVITLSWMLTGIEIVSVSGGDLAVTHRMLGLSRTKHYRGADISDLASHVAAPLPQNQISVPFLWAAKTGSVRFTYGARTVYLAEGLDLSEGRLLAASLRESLVSGGMRRGRGAEL